MAAALVVAQLFADVKTAVEACVTTTTSNGDLKPSAFDVSDLLPSESNPAERGVDVIFRSAGTKQLTGRTAGSDQVERECAFDVTIPYMVGAASMTEFSKVVAQDCYRLLDKVPKYVNENTAGVTNCDPDAVGGELLAMDIGDNRASKFLLVLHFTCLIKEAHT